mmetsp:Transcript_85205/g.237148  ORF Transcript_85205/g.237148 Transcript_85205/m.237148 type:complete len:231 (-) Transcript_85205:496-1188(-)
MHVRTLFALQYKYVQSPNLLVMAPRPGWKQNFLKPLVLLFRIISELKQGNEDHKETPSIQRPFEQRQSKRQLVQALDLVLRQIPARASSGVFDLLHTSATNQRHSPVTSDPIDCHLGHCTSSFFANFLNPFPQRLDIGVLHACHFHSSDAGKLALGQRIREEPLPNRAIGNNLNTKLMAGTHGFLVRGTVPHQHVQHDLVAFDFLSVLLGHSGGPPSEVSIAIRNTNVLD